MTSYDEYTVVQHSGYGYAGDPTFRRGLESCWVANQRQRETILRHGGLVFASYGEAEDYAMKEQYPEGYEGLVPAAPGTFDTYEVDGLRLYRPAAKREEVTT